MEQKKLIIKANDIAIKAIQSLADIALKQGGIQVMEGVRAILMSIEKIDEEKIRPSDNRDELVKEPADRPSLKKVNK